MIKFFYDEKMDEFRWGHIIGSVVALIVAIILAFSMIKNRSYRLYRNSYYLRES